MSTKKGLILVQDQYAKGETVKTSKTIGQGVAESYNKTQNMHEFQNVGTSRTQNM